MVSTATTTAAKRNRISNGIQIAGSLSSSSGSFVVMSVVPDTVGVGTMPGLVLGAVAGSIGTVGCVAGTVGSVGSDGCVGSEGSVGSVGVGSSFSSSFCSVLPQTAQTRSANPVSSTVAAFTWIHSPKLCSKVSPSVAPHLLQVLGVSQVASVQSWPNAGISFWGFKIWPQLAHFSPSVRPVFSQVAGVPRSFSVVCSVQRTVPHTSHTKSLFSST